MDPVDLQTAAVPLHPHRASEGLAGHAGRSNSDRTRRPLPYNAPGTCEPQGGCRGHTAGDVGRGGWCAKRSCLYVSGGALGKAVVSASSPHRQHSTVGQMPRGAKLGVQWEPTEGAFIQAFGGSFREG